MLVLITSNVFVFLVFIFQLNCVFYTPSLKKKIGKSITHNDDKARNYYMTNRETQ